MIGRQRIILLPLLFLGGLACQKGPGAFLQTSYAAPKAWSLVDEAGRPVTVALEPDQGRIRFQAGVIREGWAEGAGGYTHADTLFLLYGGKIRTRVLTPFLVYPLPPLPGIHRESHRAETVVWGEDTLTVEENQILTVQEGPEIVLTRRLSLNGTPVFSEERRMQFDAGDLTAFVLFQVLQGDTLQLDYRKP